MCTQRNPYNWSEQLYSKHGETIVDYLSNNVLVVLKNLHGEYLLKELVRRWQNHKIMNKWMKNFFTYLDRFYVQYNFLPSLQDAGLKHFRTVIYEELKGNVAHAVVELINEERDNGVIDRDLIKAVIEIFEAMGLGSMDCYEQDFEALLIKSTREYYAIKSSLWSESDSTPSYLLKAEACLEEEKHRIQTFLNPLSESRLLGTIEEVLLASREMELLERESSGMRALLLNDKLEDLGRMYSLFSRLKEVGLLPMSDIFKQYLIELGNEKVELRISRLESMENKERERDLGNDSPFIKEMLSLHDKYLGIILNQFKSHSLFQKSLKDAFQEFVNKDLGYHNSSLLMATFCDSLLKTGGDRISESEVESYLDKIVQLFSYLTDKDMFAEIFRNQLAKRLLNQRSASDEMERLMIAKLKMKCGGQYTSKLEGMVNDLVIGIDHQTEFEVFCREGGNDKLGSGGSSSMIEFEVQVLTSGNWPTYKQVEVILPPNMSRCIQVFHDFYSMKTTKRKLTWVHSLGTAVVRGNYAPAGGSSNGSGGVKSYDFQVTTLQAVVLLAFNLPNSTPVSSSPQEGEGEAGGMSFEVLREVVGMNEETLKRVMHSLCCGKYKLMKTSGAPNIIKNSDEFTYNATFTCPMRKIRIPMSAIEETHNPKRVEEDRSIAIEAAIVRIMKARKTLSHQQLIGEVLTQLSFFRPSPKVIKRRIEALIDREYLERDPDNQTVYKYLA